MASQTQEKEHQPFLKYSDDAGIEDSESEPDQRYHLLDGRYFRILGYALVFVLTSAMWITIIFVIPPFLTASSSPASGPSPTTSLIPPAKPNPISSADRHNITSNSIMITCGNSTSEARTSGCKYDVLLNHWVPSECWDQDFVDEYEDDGSWDAFEDEELTQPITTVEEMSEREFYWTSARDHINHCAVIWKKQFSAIFEERKSLDSIIASPGHTDHCAQYLMDAAQMNYTWSTRVEVGFAGCWIR